MMRLFLSAFAALALFTAPAAAQSQPSTPPPPARAFANINFGSQSQSQDLAQIGAFPLYEELGSFDATHAFDGGPFFEIGGGMTFFRNIGIGASFAQRTTSNRDVQLNARVPHPIFFDAFRTASASASGLERTERAVHIQALYNVPVTVEFDVTLFAGPSFFNVKDELIESVTPTEVGGDFSQVSLDAIGRSSQSNSATGFNVGIDTRYMLLRNVGVGALLRYSKGEVTLTSPTGGDDFKLDAGGLEIAAGLRFRF